MTLPTTRFSVADLERMVEADVFGDTRVELINGRVYRLAPQLSPPMAAVSKGEDALRQVRPQGEWVVIQGTLRLDQFSAPDPDLMWLPVAVGTPHTHWPLPVLIIEISDTTYRRDSGIKLRKYAQFGIKDYWIENLKEDRIEVYREPQNMTGKLSGCKYGSVTHFKRGEAIALAQRPEVSLPVDDLLP